MSGLLPLFAGMKVILTESLLPPRYVRGALGKVVGERASRDGAPGGWPHIYRLGRRCNFALHAEVRLYLDGGQQ